MSGIVVVVVVFILAAAVLGVVAFLVYQGKLRRAKSIERGLKMVPLLIHLPPPSSDTVAGGRDVKDVMREKTAQAEVLYNLIAGTATSGFKSSFYGQRHVALEIVATEGLIHFYAAVPVNMVSVIEQAVLTAYPGARLEEAEDHNIFSAEGRITATVGGELILKSDSAYPIATYANLDRDPLEGLLTTLSSMNRADGAAVQIMLRPAGSGWVSQATKLTAKLRKGHHSGVKFGIMDLAKAAVKAPSPSVPADLPKGGTNPNLSQLELTAIEQIEDKTKHPGFEVLIRVLVSADNVSRSQQLLQGMATSFALFERPGLNGFKFVPALDVQGLVTAFIFRFFPPALHSTVLNSPELATLYHLPDSQFIASANVERQMSKQVDGPVNVSRSGLIFGYNVFRGEKKEIRLSIEDRRRHTYILGQTGTGKSTMLENLVVQDMQAGNGFAFIDPHGDAAEKLLALVPKNRAEDVIYFSPGDMDYPLGLNLFEFDKPEQKDFLIQESLNILYKLYDKNNTGVIGPRFEQWYRNAALTLMSDPNGATFIEIPKVFTDTEYLKQKFKYLKDPTVIDFWTKEMGQTSDYHKSEMLGYFVSKFGAFQQNEMMRNIIGQTKSSFNLREVMDQKKILIVNLSKGRVGELNSQLLGMMFVIKFQAAAMSRADMPEAERADFSLYVDEFQNFSTDSFASILSEARKYRLNLIVANQFIAQLSPEIRDAVFGNIGTIIAHRMGPDDAEFMVKQFTPIFDAADLMNIPNFNSAVRLMVGGLPSQPFTMANLPALAAVNLELGEAIKQLSAAKFGVARPVVEADIEARLSGRPVVPAPSTQLVPEAPAKVAAPEPVVPVVAPQPAMPTPAPIVATTPTVTPVTASAPTLVSAPIVAPIKAPEVVQPAVVISSSAAVTPPPEPLIQAVPATLAMVPTTDIMGPDKDDYAPDPVRTAIGQPLSPTPPAVVGQQAPVAPASVPQPVPAEQPAPVVAIPVAPVLPTELPEETVMPAIGAPPVDLPPSVASADTLSISDITGGTRVVQAAPELEPVPLVDQMPLAPVYNPATDPMAGIELLGAPIPVADPVIVPDAPTETPVVEADRLAYDPATDPMAGVPLVAADMTAPEPILVPTPTPVIDSAVVIEPEPLSPAPVAQPEAVIEPEPLSPVVQETIDEKLPIHFIDPSLEAVLDRPLEDSMPVVLADEPVAIAEPVVAPAVLATPPPPIGAAPVALADEIEQIPTPVIEPMPVSATAPYIATETVAQVIPEPVSALVEVSAPATALASAPPPIGTPPLLLPRVDYVLPEPELPVIDSVIAAAEIKPLPVSDAIRASVPAEAPLSLISPLPVQELPAPAESATPAPTIANQIAVEVVEPLPVSEPVPVAAIATPDSAELPVVRPLREVRPLPIVDAMRAPEPVAEIPVKNEAPHLNPDEETKALLPVKPEHPEASFITKTESKAAQTDPSATDHPKLDPEAVVAKAQARIEDVLSTSLIQLDDRHDRMPDIDEDKPVSEDADSKATSTDSGRHWVGSSLPAEVDENGETSAPDDGPNEDDRSHMVSTSHKVIQPLGPIVPLREKLVEALRAEPDDVPVIKPLATPPKPPVPSPAPTTPVAAEHPKPSPVHEPAKQAPTPPPIPVAQPVAPTSLADDTFLPEAVSLAASDVAAARHEAAVKAEAEAKIAASKAAEIEPKIASPKPSQRPEAGGKNNNSRHTRGRQNASTPAPVAPAPTPASQPVPAAPAPAAAPQPPTGKLILPVANNKPSSSMPIQTAKRPEQLAKGEVYVDAAGNVTIGT